MADIDRLTRALKKADAAGDTAAAKRFASEIRKQRSTERKDMGPLGPLRTLREGFVEGIPVLGELLQGGAQRAAAGAVAPVTGESYGETLSGIQEDTEKRERAYPGLRTAGNITGSVFGTVPLAMKAPGLFGAGRGSLMMRSAASGATGGALGAADAGVRSGGDLGKLKRGASWGAGLGLIAPGVGAAVGKGVRATVNRLPSTARPSKAETAFERAASVDAVDGVPGRMQAIGDDALPMDLGPNLQRQAGALAATPGRGQEIVRGAVAGRQAQAGERIGQALDETLGQPVDTLAAADDIIAQRSAAARPLYEAAYQKAVPFTEGLESLLKRPSMGRALSKARGLAADEGIPSKQWFANVADDGTVTIENVPDVRQLDLTKRALDDMIDTAKRAGNKNEARILTGMKNDLLGMIDESVPEYARARQAFSAPSAVLDAMEQGQKVFRNNVTPAQLRREMADMGDAEKQAFIQGARAQIADIMGTARNDALAARSAFQKGYNREKLEMVVGKNRAKKLIDALEAETAFTRTRDVVTGNSETAARAAAMEEIGEGGAKGPGFFRNMLNMEFGDAVAGLADSRLASLRSARRGRANEELAALLTSRNPEGIEQTIQKVRAAQAAGEITEQQAQTAIEGIMLSGALRDRIAVPSR